jgi:hypothetical protein
MLTQTIRKLSDFRVILTYADLPTFKLVMDFRPLWELVNPTGPCCLVHWQAKPRGQRRWGIFDGTTYRSFEGYSSELPGEGLQLDENQVLTVPTAVLCYRNARVIDHGRTAEIVSG